MILELVALCIVAPGSLFVAPSGWTITQVQGAAASMPVPMAAESVPTIAVVRRLANENEPMTVPTGCQDMKAIPRPSPALPVEKQSQPERR